MDLTGDIINRLGRKNINVSLEEKSLFVELEYETTEQCKVKENKTVYLCAYIYLENENKNELDLFVDDVEIENNSVKKEIVGFLIDYLEHEVNNDTYSFNIQDENDLIESIYKY